MTRRQYDIAECLRRIDAAMHSGLAVLDTARRNYVKLFKALDSAIRC